MAMNRYPLTTGEFALQTLERIERVMHKLYSEDKRHCRRDLAQELHAMLDRFKDELAVIDGSED